MILSELMLAELRYIDKHSIRLSDTRLLHQATLKALLNRKLVARNGNMVHSTIDGHEIATRAQLNKRKFESDVSDSVKSLLHVSKILSFKKRRAA